MKHCNLFEIDSLADGEHSAVPGNGPRERNVVLRYRWEKIIFSCGEADNTSRDKWVLLSFFFLSSVKVQEKVQTVQTNMVVV